MRKKSLGVLWFAAFAVTVLLTSGLTAQEGADGFNFGNSPQEPAKEVTSAAPPKASGADLPDGKKKPQDLSEDNFIRLLLGSVIGPFFSEAVVDDNADQIRRGTHPAQKVVDCFRFFQKEKMNSPENQKGNILVAFRVALQREPKPDELNRASELVKEKGIAALVEQLFNSPGCAWKEKYGKPVITDPGPTGAAPAPGASGGKALLGWLEQAGLSGEKLKLAWCIGMAESGGNPRAFNGNSGTGDKSYGLYQINMIGNLGPARLREFGLKSNEDLFDPQTNVRVMIKMSKNGTDWSPWSAYKTGAHQRYAGQFPPK